MARVYISYKEEDLKYRNSLMDLIGANHTSLDASMIVRENLQTKTEKEIQDYLRGKLSECSVLILLVGNETHNNPWVLYEVREALSRKIKILPVRIPGTKGGIPKIIKKKDAVVLSWDSKIVQKEIETTTSERLDPVGIFEQSLRRNTIFPNLDNYKIILILDFFSKAYHNKQFNLKKGLERLLSDLL